MIQFQKMVFLHLPSTLTQEEEVLQMKYAKLRKKKKLLATIKAANSNKDFGGESKETSKIPSSSYKKPGLGTGDAKEQAKKLIRSGTINLGPAQEKDRGEKSTGFKRSQGLERKLTGLDNARAGYQPFSATHGPGGGFDTGGEDMNPEPEPPKKVTKNLYETFVAARDREERGIVDAAGESMSSLKSSDKPRQGNTVYVFGYQITEDLLKNAFSPLGKIVNISMEVEKVHLSV